MEISDERARQFVEIYKEEYGELITAEEARAAIQDALPLIELLVRSLPSELRNQAAGRRR